MIAKCECEFCRQPIEFEADDFQNLGETAHRILGQKIPCPHCARETILYLNKSAGLKVEQIQRQLKLVPCDVCGHPISPQAWFCFQCGQFHYGLFRTVFWIVCYVGMAGLILALIGLALDKLLELLGVFWS